MVISVNHIHSPLKMSSYTTSSGSDAVPSYGNFDPLGLDPLDKEMIKSGFEAVESVEGGWEFLRTYEPPADQGFMFSLPTGKRLEIDDAISNRYGGHSGSSYGWTMRNLEFIAKKGWDTFAKHCLAEKKKKNLQKTLQQAQTVDSFLSSLSPTASANPLDFATALQQDPGMRQQIPDIDEQADALKRFAEGKMTYAEMRSLCG
jgi:hypothetical protein